MIIARLLDPISKLATARLLDAATANCSLGAALGFTAVDEQELYDALDWLLDEQERIENVLARRHLQGGTLVLYDVTSTYFEGRTCPLAQYGHDRDGKGKLQIVFGLLCTAEGCPVAVEVFQGNVGDPSTLESQISKLKGRFALDRVVLVGDRGMITEARLKITALRAPAIRSLAGGGSHSAFAVRPMRSCGSHFARLSGRTVDRVPQPAAGGRNVHANDRLCSIKPRRSSCPFRHASGAPKGRYAAKTRSLSQLVR